MFVHKRDRKVGLWLTAVRQLLAKRLNAKGIDFDLRIIQDHISRPARM